MAGNRRGGRLAAMQNKRKYGADFYARIGRLGGKAGNTGGFASDVVGRDGLTGRQRARTQGAIGGSISRKRRIKLSQVK